MIYRERSRPLCWYCKVEFNLNGLPDNAVHISGFRGEDGSIVELNAVSLVYTVFSYSRFVWGCAVDAPLTRHPQNGPSAQCRPCCTHSGACKHLVSLVLGDFWMCRGDWIISCGASSQIWCVGPALWIELNIVPTKGRKVTELGSSSWSNCRPQLRALWMCWSL
jgi:hypothetical protein